MSGRLQELEDVALRSLVLSRVSAKSLQGQDDWRQRGLSRVQERVQIPDTGLDTLPHNFFLQNLIDARDASNQKAEEVLCEACAVENDENGEIPSANMYCSHCNQKLCTRCSRSCRAKSRGGPYQVVRPLGAEVSAELIQQRGSYCDQHRDERIKLYCHDCEINVCLMCFAVDHISHKCADIEKVAKEFITLFESDIIKSVSSRIDDFHIAVAQVDAENTKFVGAMDDNETLIRRRKEAVNQIAEKHMNRLLEELQSVKSGGVKEASNCSEELKLALTSLESFKVYLAELMAKGSQTDITREAKAMRRRATELLQTCVVPSDYHAPCVSFTPINIDELTNEEQNPIGRITQQTGNSGISTLCFVFGIQYTAFIVTALTVSGHIFVFVLAVLMFSQTW